MLSISTQSARPVYAKMTLPRRSRQGVSRPHASRFGVRASAEKTSERSNAPSKFVATATTAMVVSLSSPLVAEAAMTPSLKNTLLSVVAGGVVLGAIAAAVIGVSSFDKVSRK
jgi:hypothetical protein